MFVKTSASSTNIHRVYTRPCASTDCIGPGLKYTFLFIDQSSEYSIRCIVTSFVYDSSLGNIPSKSGPAPYLPVQPFKHVGGRYFLLLQHREGAERQRIFKTLYRFFSVRSKPYLFEFHGECLFVPQRHVNEYVSHKMYFASLPRCRD